MYRITYEHKDQSTENALYIPANYDYCLVTAVLKLGMGSSGELKIEIPDSNPARKQIDCLTDEIIVYRNEKEIWRGRPVTLQIDFNLTGKLTCEGILSYLYDTFYPPFEFEGSPNELLKSVIDNHNSQVEERKQFQLGEITVEDDNDYINRSSINYNRTITLLQEKFIEDSLGGYFRARVENGVRYLDYLVAYNSESKQPVQYGYNLLDIAQNVSYSDVASVLLPLGAKLTDDEGIETDERLTISSVNGGSIYIVDQQAVDTYGWIVASNTWDDVTQASNLLTKGEAYLEQITSPISQFEINAIDLSLADPEIDPINLGDFVRINVDAFDVDQYVELTQMDIDLLNPKYSTLTFGTDAASLTGSTTSSQRSIQESLGSLSMRVTSLTTNVLNAVYANIEHLITETITTQYIQAAVAELGYVTADYLEAYYIDAQTIYANFASIVQLEAVSGSITELDSDLANIKNILAGNIGTGDLQTVILTAENAVIEEAVIVDALMNTVLASVLTAGIIYTDYIKIANNESQSLWIDGGTIQFTDADGTVREQLGVDASGVYNNYIWDENGVLIWNALGLTEEGLTGNGAIIKDAAVADDANISGYKLNINEVAQILNENGDLILNATQVTIDGETLDYHLTQITQSIEGISTEGITKIENYYCLGTEDAPYYPVGTSGISSVLGGMILGQARLGESGNGWTKEQPVTDIDEWVWFAQKATYIDGHEEWTEPVLLSDYYAHKHLGVLQTEFTVVQGQIEAKVWNDDIKTAVDEATGELTTVITEQYGDLTVTLDSISEVVGKLQTTVGEDYEELYSYISGITVDMNGIKEEVRETNQIVADNYSELSEKYAQIVIDTDSIRSEVVNVKTDIADNYMTTEETKSVIDQIVDETSSTILQQVSYTYATQDEMTENTVTIKQYVDDELATLELSVENGELGSSAKIKLSATGREEVVDLDLTNVRQHFAEEDSYAIIDAGLIEFLSDTIIIDSTYFKVSETGVITATSGVIGGWTIGTDSLYNDTMSMTSKRNGTYIGTDGIRQYNDGNYLNITSSIIQNGNESQSIYTEISDGLIGFNTYGNYCGYLIPDRRTYNDSFFDGLTISLGTDGTYFLITTDYAPSIFYCIQFFTGSGVLNAVDRHIFSGNVRIINDLNCYGSISCFYAEDYNVGTFTTVQYNNSEYYGIQLSNSDNGSFIRIGESTTTGYYIFNSKQISYNGYSEKHIFSGDAHFINSLYCNSNITCDGDLIISKTIHASNYIYLNDTHYFYSGHMGSQSALEIYAVDNFWIYNSDCVVTIGSTYYGNVSYKFIVTGDSYTSGDWYSGSDRSLKDNIRQLDINTNDSIIDAIEPVQYTYKDDTEKKIHFGVTYQNICEALKEAGLDPDSCAIVSKGTQKQAHPDDNGEPVTIESDEDGEEIGAVAYMELIGPMITEIQKLRKRVAQLEQAL